MKSAPRAPALPLRDISCYILDMDGTLYLGDTVIDGALEFIDLLRQQGRVFRFFTNNSSRSPQVYVDRLRDLGFRDVVREDIITSGDVLLDYLLTISPSKHPRVYLAGTPALEEQFRAAGIALLPADCRDADYAVLGFDTTFSFEKADCLCRLVASDVPFLATNIDRVCPLDKGQFLPDCASMAAMIAHATGVAPTFIGKPSRRTADYIERATGIPLNETAFVGDRLYTDIQTALNGGAIGIAVLSGEISAEDIEKSDVRPHYVFDSVRDILQELRTPHLD